MFRSAVQRGSRWCNVCTVSGTYPKTPKRQMSVIKRTKNVAMDANLGLSEVEWDSDPFKPSTDPVKEAARRSFTEEQARVAQNRQQFENMLKAPPSVSPSLSGLKTTAGSSKLHASSQIDNNVADSTARVSTPNIKLPFDLSKNRLVKAAGLEEYIRQRQSTARDNASHAMFNAGMGAALNEFKQAKLSGEGVIHAKVIPKVFAKPFLPTWPPLKAPTAASESAMSSFLTKTSSEANDKNINSSKLLQELDLVTKNLSERSVNLREHIVRNKAITLVLVSSSSYSITACQNMQSTFHDLFVSSQQQQQSSHDTQVDVTNEGNRVVFQTALLNIADGWIAKTFFSKSMRQQLASITSEELYDSTYQLFASPQIGLSSASSSESKSAFSLPSLASDNAISRARVWWDATNRFAACAYLVDDQGYIRWQGKTADVQPSEKLLVAMSKAAMSLATEMEDPRKIR